MKATRLTVGILVIHVAAALVQFGPVLMGDRPTPHSIATTVSFLLAWGGYIWLTRKNRRCMLLAAVAGGMTAAMGLFALLARMGVELFTLVAAMLAAGFMGPLYGLRALFSEWNGLYGAALVLGLVWMGLGIFLARRAKRRTHSPIRQANLHP